MPAAVAAAWMVVTLAVPMVVADAPADRLAGMRTEFATLVDLGSEAWPYEKWPGHPRATCRPLRGDGYENFYEDLWCFECTVQEDACRAAFRFYPDLAAGTCTLQEVQVELGLDGRGLPPVVLRIIGARLGEHATVPPSEVSAFGSGSWSEIRRWVGTHDLAYLYLDDYGLDGRLPPGGQAAGFLWRRAPLIELSEEDLENPPRHEDGPASVAAACREAGMTECDAVINDQRAHSAAVHAALDVFEKLPPGSPRAAPLAYWLNFIAGDESGRFLSRDAPERERLARRGVLYADGYDGTLVLKTPWLRDLAERHPRSKWGQRAFLAMIRHHYGDDDFSEDAFRSVITHGEAFLRDHPGSAIEAELCFEVALAYETWWSLSKADPDGERNGDAATYARGAAHARRRAIDLYNRFEPRDAHERIWLEQRLFRLERDIDTDQRAYDWRGC